MKKAVVRGMMVLGVVAMAGMWTVGCSSTKKDGKQEVVGDAKKQEGSKGLFTALAKPWAPTEIVKTDIPTVDTTATSVATLYASVKAMAEKLDSVTSVNQPYREFKIACQEKNLTGQAAEDYKKTLSMDDQAKIKEGIEGTAKLEISSSTLQELLAKANELAPVIAGLAKDPKSLVTATGLGALTQTKSVTGSISRMQSQLTKTTLCLPKMIEDVSRNEYMKSQMDAGK